MLEARIASESVLDTVYAAVNVNGSKDIVTALEAFKNTDTGLKIINLDRIESSPPSVDGVAKTNYKWSGFDYAIDSNGSKNPLTGGSPKSAVFGSAGGTGTPTPPPSGGGGGAGTGVVARPVPDRHPGPPAGHVGRAEYPREPLGRRMFGDGCAHDGGATAARRRYRGATDGDQRIPRALRHSQRRYPGHPPRDPG